MITRTLMLLALAFSALIASALEVGDLHLPMTRSEADNTLTKDYTYNVLSDGTVRRTWHISQRTVSVDFDPANDKAICITVDYASPVSRKTADADAAALAPSADAKWKKTKASAVAKIGIPADSLIKVCGGKSIMFLEGSRAKKKYSAISYFAKTPTGDRRQLKPVSGEVRTALGVTSASGNIKALISVEARRQSAPPTAAPRAAAPKLAADTKPAAGNPAKPAKPGAAKKPVAAKPAQPGKPAIAAANKPSSPKVEKIIVTRVVTEAEEEEGDASDTLASRLLSAFASGDDADDEEYDNLFDLVKAKANPYTLAAAGGVLLVLLMLVLGAIARARTKRRQRAMFEEVIANGPANNSRKVPVAKKEK